MCEATTPRVEKLLNAIRVIMVPTLNPDGYAKALANHDDNARCSSSTIDSTVLGRANAKNVDLDHNFPRSGVQLPDATQPETAALLSWLDKAPGVALAANLVSGNLVAIYPWDLNPAGKDAPSPPPDASLLKGLASSYAGLNPDIGKSDVSLDVWMSNLRFESLVASDISFIGFSPSH